MLSTSPRVIPISFHVLQQPHTQFTTASLITIGDTTPTAAPLYRHTVHTREREPSPLFDEQALLPALHAAAVVCRRYGFGSVQRRRLSFSCGGLLLLVRCAHCERVTTTSAVQYCYYCLLLLPLYRDREKLKTQPVPPRSSTTTTTTTPTTGDRVFVWYHSQAKVRCVIFEVVNRFLLSPCPTLNTQQQQQLRSKANNIISCVRQAGSAGGV